MIIGGSDIIMHYVVSEHPIQQDVMWDDADDSSRTGESTTLDGPKRALYENFPRKMSDTTATETKQVNGCDRNETIALYRKIQELENHLKDVLILKDELESSIRTITKLVDAGKASDGPEIRVDSTTESSEIQQQLVRGVRCLDIIVGKEKNDQEIENDKKFSDLDKTDNSLRDRDKHFEANEEEKIDQTVRESQPQKHSDDLALFRAISNSDEAMLMNDSMLTNQSKAKFVDKNNSDLENEAKLSIPVASNEIEFLGNIRGYAVLAKSRNDLPRETKMTKTRSIAIVVHRLIHHCEQSNATSKYPAFDIMPKMIMESSDIKLLKEPTSPSLDDVHSFILYTSEMLRFHDNEVIRALIYFIRIICSQQIPLTASSWRSLWTASSIITHKSIVKNNLRIRDIVLFYKDVTLNDLRAWERAALALLNFLIDITPEIFAEYDNFVKYINRLLFDYE